MARYDYKKVKFESVRVCGIPCMFVDIREILYLKESISMK